jgi:tetratricopeptide (TPR) repeat protein
MIIVVSVYCKASAGVLPSLSESEIGLRADSTDARAWGVHGLALLSRGEDHSEWVLQRSLSLGGSPESLRGLASLAVQENRYNDAVELLARNSPSVCVSVMLCSVFQESGNCKAADSILQSIMTSAEFPDAVSILRIRQYRCEGFTCLADSLALATVSGSGNELAPLIKLDLLLSGDIPVYMETSEILTAMKQDFVVTGSVYLKSVVSSLASIEREADNPFQASRILQLSGDLENAERIITSLNEDSMNQEEVAFYCDLLLQLDKLNEAESLVRKSLESGENSSALYITLGKILVKGGRYREAYSTMTDAVEITESPECMALMGLAAENAHEFIMAVDAYSPLLAMSADSIVLVNRTRNWFRKDYLERLSESSAWENDNSSISGSLSVSYYEFKGKYPQKNTSLGGTIRYGYGLYSSSIFVSGNASNSRWPSSQYNHRKLNLSAGIRNFTSRHLFQNLNVSWEYSKDKTTKWKLQSIASLGYSFSIAGSFTITPSIGVGKIINRWDDEMYQRNSYVYNPGLVFFYYGNFADSFRPGITISGNGSFDFADRDQYELNSSISFSGALGSFLSVSCGYSVAYQSVVPPLNKSQTDTSTRASLNFHF